jgi:hypothetical protein
MSSKTIKEYQVIADRFKAFCSLPVLGLRSIDTPIPGVILSEYLKENPSLSELCREQIRFAYVFRWVLGLKNNTDRCLRVLISDDGERIAITSWNEKEPTLEVSKSRIPKTALKKWFDNDFDKVLSTFREMFGDGNSTIEEMRSVLEDEFPSHIAWLNIIRDNIYRIRQE